MLLPTKTLSPSRSLISIGGVLLRILDERKPISRAWEDFKRVHYLAPNAPKVTFAMFVMALDVLYMIGAVSLIRGQLVRSKRDDPPNLQQ